MTSNQIVDPRFFASLRPASFRTYGGLLLPGRAAITMLLQVMAGPAQRVSYVNNLTVRGFLGLSLLLPL